MLEDISSGLESVAVPCEPRDGESGVVFPSKFRYVTRNIPGPGCDRGRFEEQLSGCECSEKCVPETCLCLQRFEPAYDSLTGFLRETSVSSPSLRPVVECNNQCACSKSCFNRLVQRGLIVKVMVCPSRSKGFGLFAAEDVQRLAFVCEYAGEVVGISEAEQRLRDADSDMNYLIVLREHCSTGVELTCVDPRLAGNVGRFANHSCDPNLLMVPVRVDNLVPKLALFARRDICAGEELTFDYSGEAMLQTPQDHLLGSCSTTASPTPQSQRGEYSENKAEGHNICSKEEKHQMLKEGNDCVNMNCFKITSPGSERPGWQHDGGVAYTELLSSQHKSVGHQSQSPYFESPTQECTVDYSHRKRKADTLSVTVNSSLTTDNRQTVKTTVGQTDSDTDKNTLVLCSDDTDRDPISYDIDKNTGTAVCNQRKRLKTSCHEVDGNNDSFDSHAAQSLNTFQSQLKRKPCLCGSSSCKGYLPYENLIFN